MSVSWKHLFLFCLLLTAAPSWGNGGADGAGGGKAVLCDGKLRTLDLYEAEEIYHLHIDRSQSDLQSAVKAYFPKLVKYVSPWLTNFDGSDIPAYRHRSELDWSSLGVVTDHFKDIPKGTHLPLTPDATTRQLPENCQIVQVFVQYEPFLPNQNEDGWDGSPSKISRDNFYWNMLSPVDQAALILHELLYNIQGLRFGANSDDVRRVIGLIFSDQELPQFHKFLVDVYENDNQTYLPEVTECTRFFRDETVVNPDIAAEINRENPNYQYHKFTTLYWFDFFMVDESRDGERGVGFYFDRLNGIRQIMETSAFVPGLTRAQLFRNPTSTINVVAVNEITGKKIHLELGFEREHEPDWNWRMHIKVKPGDLPPLTSDIADRLTDESGGPGDGYCDLPLDGLDKFIPRQK